MRRIMSEFLEIGEKSYYVWKNKSHPILIQFIEKYFDEKDLKEFLETGKINRLENVERSGEIKDKELEDHILFNAIVKIKEAGKFNINKLKGFWTEGFIRAVENADEYSKKALISELEKLDMKFWQHSNWKKITIEWIQENLSGLEVKLVMKYKERVIQSLSKK